ncbi:MAG: glycine--tRNA ligase subunit beta, partial [Alphaproteobacteria bacterium]|nr:glycine--tRNA ligase subunit beta [Alphaproteobacteria bacterium]
GPRVGAPQPAIDGFLRSVGLKSLGDCEQRDTGKGVFYFALIELAGRATAALLPDLVAEAIHGLAWPKSMTWANTTFRWVRPLHSILCVFNGHPVAGALDLGGEQTIAFGDTTVGHRFLSPERFAVANVGAYKAKLQSAHVILDRADRRAAILKAAEDAAAREGLRLRRDEGLLDEVCGLVEWPMVRVGHIDAAFMDVPPEVLTTAMRAHQKYFAVEKADGALAPRFIVVANMLTDDGGRAVIAGNERVLRARLSDAKFFWDQDRKKTLDQHGMGLGGILFYQGLGTMEAKALRLMELAETVADRWVPGAERRLARRAGHVCKADLTTGMVGEFPELQGIMGRYYANHHGEDSAVADAIGQHYSPLGPQDRCPTAPVTVAVALADKLDTLIGFFGIDEKPTGSRDPFALRRAALGAIRLILENKLRVPLADAFAVALKGHGGLDPALAAGTVQALLEFFADRLKVHLREQGVRHDLISAVFGVIGGEDDLVRLLARVDALRAFLDSADGADLLIAYRRAANILKIEEKKDAKSYDRLADPRLFRLDQERVLFDAVAGLADRAQPLIAAEDFSGVMAVLARLREPVDAFFDHVTVNSDKPDERANRLCLLSQIRVAMNAVADFSRIEG